MKQKKLAAKNALDAIKESDPDKNQFRELIAAAGYDFEDKGPISLSDYVRKNVGKGRCNGILGSGP